MPTINSNVFPLGLITTTAGTLRDLFQNFPAIANEDANVHMILFESFWTNTGRVYIGKTNLSVAGRTGIVKVLHVAGDTFTLSGGSALNILDLKDWRIDVDVSGEGVLVTAFTR